MRLTSVVAMTLLAGCSSHYSASDLAGKYVLSAGGGVDTLELRANGTYSDSYKDKSGEVNHQEGAWTIEKLQAGSTVVLDNFRSSFAGNGQKRGFYLLLVKRSFGTLYLVTNIDLGEGYKRQP